jgi:multidrug efflux pump subunit AcrB
VKNISAWAIRHPVSPLVLFVVLTFVGIVSFIRLPINEEPDIAFPLVTVTVDEQGAAPTEIDTQIVQKIEGSIATVSNIKRIVSLSMEGESYTSVEFQIGTPVDRAVSDVRDAVAKVRSQLPQNVQEPIVQRVDIDGGAIVYYAVSTTSLSEEQLSWFVDNTITKRLLGVSGVAQVQRGGGVDREIRVDLDPARMQALGLTAVDVNRQLQQLNIDAPGGRAQLGNGEQSIRVLGGASSALALGDTQVMLPGGRFARLSDMAEVHDGVAEVRKLSRLDGRPATTFGVLRARGSSDVTVLKGVEKELAKINKDFPHVKITQIFTSVDQTYEMFTSSMLALIEGSFLAVLVVWFFLRNLRATAISALAIPLSAIPTFAFMQWMGFTLNEISLLALSLVAGVLVDDAIVEIENIVRHMRMGKSGFQAALDAADEIGLAVVACSATIIAVFLPVSFMGGITGQFFEQFGLTVAAAVFFSLLVARLITPVIAAYSLRSDSLKVHQDGPVMSRYMKTLRWCVLNRWKTIAFGALFFVLSIVAFGMLPTTFAPNADITTSALNIELPPGVRLEDTSALAAQASAILRRQPEVTHIVEAIGEGGSLGDEVRNAVLYISLVPREQRKLTSRQFEHKMITELRKLPDARIDFQTNGAGSGNGRDITLYLTGDDSPLVQSTAQQVVQEMRSLPQLREPRINGDLPRPEIVIRPRFDLAAQMGVTVQSISQTVLIATLGDIPQNVAKFSLPDRQIPIRVSLIERARNDLATLQNLPVPTASGQAVPLKAVADLSFGEGPTKVRRYNQSRRVMIDADLNGVELGDAMKLIRALPTMKNLPTGVRMVEVGDVEIMTELFTNFALAMATGILMVFAVLVLLFARVFQPVTILSALPLSVGGAAVALMICRMPVSLPVVIGFLMLMGIVAKNSILLVDFAIEEMRAGRDRLTALLESGHKRARPIVMTTVAMIAGMLPVAAGFHGDNSFRAPMAVAVIGGLLTSTLLTLVIVPAAFTVVDDIERWLGPKVASALASQPSKPAAPAKPYPAS